MKQEYIDSLNPNQYKQLMKMIISNKNIVMEKVGLYVDDDNHIYVDMEERPIEYFSTMGCRTVNGLDINAFDNFKANVQYIINGEFDKIDDIFSGVIKDGRGNICPVTIILPTLAAMTRKKAEEKDKFNDKEYVFTEFMKILDKKIHEAKDMLLERFNHICSQSAKSGKFMYTNHTMAGYHEDEGIISALKHGTIVIGQLGLSETLYLLFGFDHTSEQGMKYAKEIEKMFNVRCAEFKQEYKLNFGVYYTPAENLVYTSFKKFCKDYPEYDLENITWFINSNGEKEYKNYFTNSIHVPVYYDCDPFEKIDIESQLVSLSNAGCITYVELNDNCYYNVDAVEKLIDYAMEHDIPYFAINVHINQCAECGERIWDSDTKCCPKCGSEKIDRLGRVTGYLSTTYEHFNPGKQEEFLDRVKHIKN
jgi:ribonucleoside-triphosphate reductase